MISLITGASSGIGLELAMVLARENWDIVLVARNKEKLEELKEKLWENVNALQNGLKERGFDIGTTQSCVTPVYLKGSITEAMALVKDLRENHGIFCSIVVYPVIPKGLILLRMIPTATHTLKDVEETLTAFESIRTRLENGTYKRLSAAVAAAMRE